LLPLEKNIVFVSVVNAENRILQNQDLSMVFVYERIKHVHLVGVHQEIEVIDFGW